MNIAALSSLLALTLVVVPIDDRPVTAQLPQLLGAVAGARVVEPPAPLLGSFLRPGDPPALLRWLGEPAAAADAYVVSGDMIAYGGLVASRIPATALDEADARLAALATLRERRGAASFAYFGTVMRLAPTGVPAVGPAAAFPFAGGVWPQIQEYANLPDPPRSAPDLERAGELRGALGAQLDAYLAARARDLAVDRYALRLAAGGFFDRIVLGQDDAGPVGLHLRDLATLRADASQLGLDAARLGIQPGTDELAMALVAAALTRRAGIVPRVRVVYSRPGGPEVHDPLEFAPIATTIGDVVRTCGATIGEPADVTLYVRVPQTEDADENAFVDAIARDPEHAAIADLSFLPPAETAEEQRLLGELTARGVAARVLAYASWNTTANTVGTAVPEAVAVLAGRRLGTYDARAHQTFTLMRYVDDVLFQKTVRPRVQADLERLGIPDHGYLLPADARFAESDTRLLLWPAASELLAQLAPQYRADLRISLPWNRTFETRLELRLNRSADRAR